MAKLDILTIKPLLDGSDVQFVGEVNDKQKNDFLGNAPALLFPIDWPEPFGLVMIEAMACGTPVIAWRRGSVPELVQDGVTGFIVDSEEEAVSAIAKLATLDRARVRSTAHASVRDLRTALRRDEWPKTTSRVSKGCYLATHKIRSENPLAIAFAH